MERRLGLKNLNSSGLIPVLPPTCCVTLGNPAPLSELQLPYLQNGDNISFRIILKVLEEHQA